MALTALPEFITQRTRQQILGLITSLLQGSNRVGSEIKPLITIPTGVGELLLEVPLGLLRHMLLLLPLTKGWGLEHEGLVLVGALLGLPGGLRHLLPDLLAGRHVDVPVLVPEEEAVLEELLDVGLGGLHRLYLLLKTLELSISGCNLGLLLLLLETLLLDLGPGLPPGS